MYKIIGADQKEYGPVTADQIRQWIAEGRANAQTPVKAENGQWKPLSSFPEFATHFEAPPPPGPYPASLEAEGPKTNNWAVAGLVTGILGLLCCGPLFATLAIVFSFVGLNQINQQPHLYTGRNLAIAGIVLGILGFVLFFLFLLTGGLERLRDLPF